MNYRTVHVWLMAVICPEGYVTSELRTQSYWTFGWDRKFQLWCNPNDSGASFGPHGYKLARVLWIHYVSKVGNYPATQC